MTYPRWRTHPELGPIIVNDADEEAMVFPEPEPDPEPVIPPPPPERRRVKAKAQPAPLPPPRLVKSTKVKHK